MNSLKCYQCHQKYPIFEPRWRCDCGGVLDIDFSVSLDVSLVAQRPPNLWRYREAIPLPENAHTVSFSEGFTPLLPVVLSEKTLFVKQDYLFPSGSYKDRGATVLISLAKWLGVERVVEDSSGNAGCAIAAYCASAKIDCEVFVPSDTSPGKLAQIQRYGAHLRMIPGSREDTATAVMKFAKEGFYASHSWNPFFFQGTKTWAYEVCEQLGWAAPDTVVLPAGNGTLLLGAAIGFRELAGMGIIRKIPRIIAVQAENCAPLARAYAMESTTLPLIEKKGTLAEGIAIAEPIRGKQILQEVRDSGGDFLAVAEKEIVASLDAMCRLGFYIEPTSAAVIAGARRYAATSDSREVIVTTFTGSGLKATEKMIKLLEECV